jgi:hypothetical protein
MNGTTRFTITAAASSAAAACNPSGENNCYPSLDMFTLGCPAPAAERPVWELGSQSRQIIGVFGLTCLRLAPAIALERRGGWPPFLEATDCTWQLRGHLAQVLGNRFPECTRHFIVIGSPYNNAGENVIELKQPTDGYRQIAVPPIPNGAEP